MANNFNEISLADKGIVLGLKSNEQKEISFSEIDKISIEVIKTPMIYVFLFVMLSISIVLVSLWIYGFELVIISPLLLIIFGVIKLNNYKRYFLKINLKIGNPIIQRIPLKLKHKTINAVNKIHNEFFYYVKDLKIAE
jgi:hypothetical protein